MEPLAIATLAFNFLKPLVKAGSEEFVKDSAKDLWSLVKSLFEKHHKEDSLSEISEKTTQDLAVMLEEDPETKSKLEQQIDHLKKTGVYQQVTGDYNIVLESITNSTINISGR